MNDKVSNRLRNQFQLQQLYPGKKGRADQEQKDAIIDFVENHFLGQVLVSPGATKKQLQEAEEDLEWQPVDMEDLKSLLDEGYPIKAWP